jgi:hypothetical protein
VKVQARYSFSFIPFVKLGTVNLVGSATMRVEQKSSYTLGDDAVACP